MPISSRSLAVFAASLLIACTPPAPGGSAMPAGQDAAGTFDITGNPESAEGATWTFRGTVDGERYDLAGVLLKPPGGGPFPAVVLSHGSEGSAAMLMRSVGTTMVKWGLVCIATNYTHSAGVPMGSPGGSRDVGASRANVLRAHMTRELLRRLGYVDMARIALHGHSMGAYLDAAAASAFPTDFRVASATGGGIRPDRITSGPAPGPAQVDNIRIPFQLHHGDDDATVPLEYDLRFAALLERRGVPHELYRYPGGHLAPRSSPLMLDRVHDWYAKYGMF